MLNACDSNQYRCPEQTSTKYGVYIFISNKHERTIVGMKDSILPALLDVFAGLDDSVTNLEEVFKELEKKVANADDIE